MRIVYLGAFASLAMALCSYTLIQCQNKSLRHSLPIKQNDKLAVSVAACFVWLFLALVVVGATGNRLGIFGCLSLVLVLLYLSLDVKAVHPYVGPLKDFKSGDSLNERSTQISAAAFAVGSLLLNSRRDLAPKVSPLIFLAILLSVSSTITSASAKQCILRKSSDWEAVQRASMGISAGLLALAVGICIDEAFLLSSAAS
jgi:hypothetical protein